MDLSEASVNFDQENLYPFLLRIIPFIEAGFGEAEARRVEAFSDAIPHDEEQKVEFQVTYRGVQTLLNFRIFKDDIDAPDVYFKSHPELIQQIRGEFEPFFGELGL